MKKFLLPLFFLFNIIQGFGQELLPAGESAWIDSTGANWIKEKGIYGVAEQTTVTLHDVPTGWTTKDPYDGYLSFDGSTIPGGKKDTLVMASKLPLDLSNGGPFIFMCEQYYKKDSSQTYLRFSPDSVNWHMFEINRIPQGDSILKFKPFRLPKMFQVKTLWIQLVMIINLEINGTCEARWVLDDMKAIQLPVVRMKPFNQDTIINNMFRLCDGDSIVLYPKILNPPLDLNFQPRLNWESGGEVMDSLLIIRNPGVVKLIGESDLQGVNLTNVIEADNDSLNVEQQVPFDEKIFLVTVDTATGKYLVVWRRTENKGTVSYKVYKDLPTGKKFLANIPVIENPVFIDMMSNPAENPGTYIITTVDKCGHEAVYAVAKSNAHLPMKLMVNNDLTTGLPKLTWNKYNGFSYSKFYIFRGDTSVNMTLYDSIDFNSSDSLYTYIDNNPLDGNNYYRVEVDRGEVLNFGKKSNSGPFSRSLSNLEDNRLQETSLGSSTNVHSILLYPNPFNKSATLSFDNPKGAKFFLKIYDISGKLVRSEKLSSSQYSIQRNGLSPGYYMIELKGDKTYRGNMIIQ
ncbi:MAG: T9SS type A sorting domain-containing protein [bacterium]